MSSHSVQDNNNDDHSLAPDASGLEGEAHSTITPISQSHDPPVKKSRSSSQRRRRKSRRITAMSSADSDEESENDRHSSASDTSDSEGEADSRTAPISRDYDPQARKPTSPDSEGKAHSKAPPISRDHDPEVETSGPPSPRRRRKRRRRTMAMSSADSDEESENDRHSSASDTSDSEGEADSRTAPISRDYDPQARKPTSPDSEGEGHSKTPPISRDQDPEVETSRPPSPRRRRKRRRRTMGMERAEYINRGHDPLDYERKFPEDKQYEELGQAARVWRTYLEECAIPDSEMVEGWRDGLDVLLVFAGLFSAVVTTFVAQTSQSLQVDYGKVTTLLLIELINVQRSASNGSLVDDVPHSDLTFHPSTSDSWVNGLWFTSLSLSLTAALFAVLTKQWIHQYMSASTGTPQQRCHMRQFRYMGLQQWGVGLIIGLLPVLMSASLAVFLVGLVVFLIPLRVSIASVVGAITFIAFSAYFVTNFLPVIYPSCPYKTPLSQYMFSIHAYIQQAISKLSPAHRAREARRLSLGPPSFTACTLGEAESKAVHHRVDDMNVQALVWLINTSSNPSVETIVMESTSCLQLKSVDFFRDHSNVDAYSACLRAFDTLLYEPDISLHEHKVDRLIRAILRFTSVAFYTYGPKPDKDTLSPTLYADLLCIRLDCEEESQELVMNSLMTDELTDLSLQPIIWAYLLQRASGYYDKPSPDKLVMMQLLFIKIPLFYWKANYAPSTCTFNTFEMKLPTYIHNYNARLGHMIKHSLHSYVAEQILHPYVHQSYYDFSRLRLLLSMVSSSTMRSVSPIAPFTPKESLFIMIIESIGAIIDIDSPHKDNDNRHTVLESLHTLITSDEFDNPLTPHEQTSALMMFFRVLNCTSPCPPNLKNGWCTLQLATKFVQIASRDLKCPRQLGTLLFQHTSFTNKTLASFISDLFKELCIQPNALCIFLCLIIPQLGTEHLGLHVYRQSLEYLHEPDNLFTSCTALIQQNDTQTLRCLALLQCRHGSWSSCIQQLEDSELDKEQVADFKAFIEAKCEGAYGKDDTAPEAENDRPLPVPQHPWSMVQHKVQQFMVSHRRKEPSHSHDPV
ncbi:hypothetical protein IW261DRAFT_1431441 [Armillaria novae-zelandiae]|uniref:DUF6535 domain-containing protein n=1 Tax=Armillaria novae-zelandiae TaxID=153914 RepID=A0AA39UI44_9AGAR|nr:hypothetical protein IW261DRAFT_1431441 [Armillaria novae-zelandiae]